MRAHNDPAGTAATRASGTTPSLRELQAAFADSVFTQDSDSVLRYVTRGRFPPQRHLQVYRNNVFASLTAALAAVFPVVARLVGDGFFNYAAHDFIRHHPPRGGNLHDFGVEFPDFLSGFEPAAQLVYLPDTARLEWAYHEVYHTAADTPLSPEKLARIPPAEYAALRFSLQRGLRLIASDYPILKIWQVNQPDYTADDHVDLTDGAARILLSRHKLQVELLALSTGEYALLTAFQAGSTFADACEAALAAELDFDLTNTLQRHVNRGALTDFR